MSAEPYDMADWASPKVRRALAEVLRAGQYTRTGSGVGRFGPYEGHLYLALTLTDAEGVLWEFRQWAGEEEWFLGVVRPGDPSLPNAYEDEYEPHTVSLPDELADRVTAYLWLEIRRPPDRVDRPAGRNGSESGHIEGAARNGADNTERGEAI
ncbi:hypothetical protein [Embleya sp. NPDC059237]|uniref:hypothetical protein n=1 Tax=Embleya sp. NPDC059237 TaxID=3346784 RepID=UPI0036C37796